MANSSLLDPILIAQLGNLQLRARRILDGLYSGRHFNLTKGHAQDFSEHRPYNPGDDLRALDWKVFGRTDRLVIRQYEEQTNVGAVVVLDDSASMGFSSEGRPSKLEYAKTMAAALGYLVVSQHDAIGVWSSKGQLPPRSQRAHLDQCFDLLDGLNPQGVWNFQNLSESLGPSLKKKSFVLIFSDLMANANEVLAQIQTLSSRRHEVLVFQVLDPAERDLDFHGPVLFKDLESGEEIRTEPDVLRPAYQAWVNQHLAGLEQSLRGFGVDYHLLTTNTPFDKGMGAFLSWRSARI